MALLLVAPACDAGSDSTLDVFAAASLTRPFTALARDFERDRGIQVRLNFLSSNELATQIEQGAEADVFASADIESIERVDNADLLAEPPLVFAENALVIVVRDGNPEGLRAMEDLERDELVLSVCDEECPLGRYSRAAFSKAEVDPAIDSIESDSRAVVTRVALGEADAGVAFASDATVEGVDAVAIPAPINVIAQYPIAPITETEEARQFIAHVLSSEGRSVLERFGFETP